MFPREATSQQHAEQSRAEPAIIWRCLLWLR